MTKLLFVLMVLSSAAVAQAEVQVTCIFLRPGSQSPESCRAVVSANLLRNTFQLKPGVSLRLSDVSCQVADYDLIMSYDAERSNSSYDLYQFEMIKINLKKPSKYKRVQSASIADYPGMAVRMLQTISSYTQKSGMSCEFKNSAEMKAE